MNGDGLRNLSNEDLLARLDELTRQEKQLGAEIVAHLAEVERRSLHLLCGYSSLFKYCVEKLGLAGEVAYKRMQAARAVNQCPVVLEHLASGELSLSSVGKIAPHLKKHGEALVEAARGKSVREVMRLVAELDTHPVASSVKMTPVAGGKVKIEMVVDAQVADGIEEAMAIDRHIDPSGDKSALLGRMVRSYLKQRKKERYAATDKPRSACSSEGESRELARRTVPAQVQREAIERDGERCSYVSPDGTRCTETGFLEIDHRHPVALGGRADDAAQVRILCRAHNQYEADRAYGARYMDHRRAEARPGSAREFEQAAAGITTALHQMGFTKTESRNAVACAMQHNPTTDLSSLLRTALQATQPPK